MGDQKPDSKNKGKGDDRIAFKTRTKLVMDTEAVFSRIVTPLRKKKGKAHATCVSILVKLPTYNKLINFLQKNSPN